MLLLGTCDLQLVASRGLMTKLAGAAVQASSAWSMDGRDLPVAVLPAPVLGVAAELCAPECPC